jgi:hypothetical protein
MRWNRTGRWVPLGLAAGLVACASPGEDVTAPERAAEAAAGTHAEDVRTGAGPCVRLCAQLQTDAARQELERHRRALEACNDDGACLIEEAVLHAAVLGEIAADSRACKEACR